MQHCNTVRKTQLQLHSRYCAGCEHPPRATCHAGESIASCRDGPAGSAAIREKKDRINDTFAHANVVSTNQTFEVNEAINEISTPFFDVEDEFQVKVGFVADGQHLD